MPVFSWTENYGEDQFLSYDLSQLKRDDYYLTITNNSTSEELQLYKQFEECYKCPFKYVLNIPSNYTTIESSEYKQLFQIRSKQETIICNISENFGEFGVYEINVRDNGCSVRTLKEDVNIYAPILTVFLIYSLMFILIYLVGYGWRKVNKTCNKEQGGTPKKERVKSLDTFRGISIVLMIFVNYGCGGYEIFDHATWNGLHIADVIFPWFLWIMGVCIPISLTSSFKRGISKKAAIFVILRRSCILFLIGLFLGASPYLNKLRILGVLQRFGICYFVVGTICVLFFNNKSKPEGKIAKLFEDVLRLEFEWIAIIVILVLHCFLTYIVAAPECPKGYLGPGGYHDNVKYFNCTGGAAGYIDRLLLGNHVYRYPTIKKIYNSMAYDPEGILGSLTSIIQVFFGVQAGATLLVYKEHKGRMYRWLTWGMATGIIGGGLCGFSKNDGFIPINKNLWSISFVLVTTSLAFLLLCACYYFVDVKQWWTGKPFLFAGMNSTIMYIGHSMTGSNFIIHWYIDDVSINRTHFLTLFDNVWATCMWIIIAYYLYKRKFFLSI